MTRVGVTPGDELSTPLSQMASYSCTFLPGRFDDGSPEETDSDVVEVDGANVASSVTRPTLSLLLLVALRLLHGLPSLRFIFLRQQVIRIKESRSYDKVKLIEDSSFRNLRNA